MKTNLQKTYVYYEACSVWTEPDEHDLSTNVTETRQLIIFKLMSLFIYIYLLDGTLKIIFSFVHYNSQPLLRSFHFQSY